MTDQTASGLSELVNRLLSECERMGSVQMIRGADLLIWNELMREAAAALCSMAEAQRSGVGDAVYAVFDGPPGHEAGRFVEVETAQGNSVSVGRWKKREDGYWTLGPFYVAPSPSPTGAVRVPVKLSLKECASAVLDSFLFRCQDAGLPMLQSMEQALDNLEQSLSEDDGPLAASPAVEQGEDIPILKYAMDDYTSLANEFKELAPNTAIRLSPLAQQVIVEALLSGQPEKLPDSPIVAQEQPEFDRTYISATPQPQQDAGEE